MIGVRIVTNEPEVVAVLRAKPLKLARALVHKMTELMTLLQQKIVRDKLSGQVLHHRSGKLAGSVHVIYPKINGTIITAGVRAAGGAAWYGRVHEFGGTRTYVINPVRKEVLRFFIGGKAVFAKYVFHPPLPKRAFMAPALQEMRSMIAEELAKTVGEVLVS